MQLMEIIENSDLEPKNLTVEELFHVLLHALGFSFKIKGTKYLEEFFSLVYETYTNPCDIESFKMYEVIARNNNTTVASVSRQIIYSITTAWDKGNHQLQNELFAPIIDTEKGKPTVHEFTGLMMELFKQL